MAGRPWQAKAHPYLVANIAAKQPASLAAHPLTIQAGGGLSMYIAAMPFPRPCCATPSLSDLLKTQIHDKL